MLNELLIKLGEQIKATQFFAAVGFSFSSGLRLVKPLMDQVRSNNGKIELVVGALQTYGYVLNDSEVTVRKSSILKIEQSIEELFRTIKKENIEYLQWKLNLKITGFIIERHKYGWLFFYSQITDLSLLFHLDDVVQKLIKRYKLEGEIKVKRFVRTYAEMHMALHETKYIPNLDDLGLDDKKAILSDIYQIDLSDKDERFVEIQFHRIMKREIRDIEKDIENIS